MAVIILEIFPFVFGITIGFITKSFGYGVQGNNKNTY
jgi:hypothetical protein